MLEDTIRAGGGADEVGHGLRLCQRMGKRIIEYFARRRHSFIRFIFVDPHLLKEAMRAEGEANEVGHDIDLITCPKVVLQRRFILLRRFAFFGIGMSILPFQGSLAMRTVGGMVAALPIVQDGQHVA